MPLPSQSDGTRPIRSGRDFCRRYFPKAHAEKTCGCYPKPGVLVIMPRKGRR